jgi:hypothetical protein
MPFFDWSAPWDQVAVRHRLWVYFAIDVPLTFIILVVVTFWLKSRKLDDREMVEKKLNSERAYSPSERSRVWKFGFIPAFERTVLCIDDSVVAGSLGAR